MSRKKEHSKGGRQYAKRKKSGDDKEEPVKTSRRLTEKGTTASTKATEAEKEPTEETEPDRELTEIRGGITRCSLDQVIKTLGLKLMGGTYTDPGPSPAQRMDQ